MAVWTEVVAVRYEDVSAGAPISVPYPLYEALDVKVYYGAAPLLAVYNTDYTVTLGGDFDTFTLTPTASLINKIDALITADPTNEENYITVRRRLDYLTDSTAAAVRYTPFTSREFERTVLRFQQIQEQLNRCVSLTPNFVGNEPRIQIAELVANRVLMADATGLNVVAGPTAQEVENAEGYAEQVATAKTEIDAIVADLEDTLAAASRAAFETLAEAMASTPDVSPNTVVTRFYDTSYEPGTQVLWRKSATEPTHPGKFQDGKGTWYEWATEYVYVRAWGAKGDGATDDRAKLNECAAIAEALGVAVLLRKGTYIVTPAGQRTAAGTGTRWYCLDHYDNLNWIGFHGQCTIKLKDGQSTDASHRDINIFMPTDTAMKNHRFYGIVFDCNGDNNKISPSRASHVYNHYCSGAYNLTGDEAWIDGLYFQKCGFINCPGTNNIVTGQSQNGYVGPLSRNIRITDCVFKDNGTDTSDHSSVYAWGENVWCERNVFEQSDGLSKTDKNWVSFEIHGANTWFRKNVVKNYYRGCWVASNFTRAANNLHVEENLFSVWGFGPSLFRCYNFLTEVHDVHIARNRIYIREAPPIGPAACVSIVTEYPVYNIYVHDNSMIAAASGYDAHGVSIGCPTAGQTISHVYVHHNHVERCTIGFLARLNPGNGYLTDIHETDNTYLQIGDVNPTSAGFGSFYQADDGTVSLGVIESRRNRYLARNGTNFDWGQHFAGTIAKVSVDENEYEGLVNFPSGLPYSINNAASIDVREGDQICTGTNAPTSGTWKYGAVFHNFAPTRIRNIDHWKYDGANWRAYGTGFGSTAERPALTSRDQGYSYFDATLAKMIFWGGADGWYV